MPSDLALKAMNVVHRVVLAVSGGRFGWRAGGMPVLELTTRGRRSGQARSVLLTSPVQEGDVLVLVASRGGDDESPAWLLNLTDDPRVEVRVGGGEPRAMQARIASAAERDRLWPQVIARYGGYGAYQRRTDREIPLVLLSPRE